MNVIKASSKKKEKNLTRNHLHCASFFTTMIDIVDSYLGKELCQHKEEAVQTKTLGCL